MRRRALLAALALLIAGSAWWWLHREPPDAGVPVAIEELREGTGALLKPEKTVTVHYVARVLGGAVYSESRSKGQPFTFVVGKGQVLEGWEKGIRGMKEGGLRKILIPPELAYGDRGAPPLIPPKATLEIEVELLRVNP